MKAHYTYYSMSNHEHRRPSAATTIRAHLPFFLTIAVLATVWSCLSLTADTAVVKSTNAKRINGNSNSNNRRLTSAFPSVEGFGVSTIPRSFIDIDRLDLNCPDECTCTRGYINCTARSLRYVPSRNRRTNYTTFLPHAMWLNDNQFGVAVAAVNFSDWSLLKTLSLRNCSIRRITAMTFASMSRLAILDLSHNGGRLVVDAFAFTGTNLEALLLDENPGILFSDRSFENATIRSLRIRRCKLTTLSPDVFIPLTGSIESLFASENELTGLSSRFESMFMSISFFDVSKNPWVCDCDVEWLVRVFVNRLNRTRSLNPVDEWGSASGHGLPVPTCVVPSQRNGVLIDALRLGSDDFLCTAAAVIDIDVEQLRERNQTRFRCSAAGNPVAIVSWHFPRTEDEYNWALSLVENSSTVISPNAYSSATSPGLVIVSQAFLTVVNRPAVTISASAASLNSNLNKVRLVCKAVNVLGSASLMTNFDVTQRQLDDGSPAQQTSYSSKLNVNLLQTITTIAPAKTRKPSTVAVTTTARTSTTSRQNLIPLATQMVKTPSNNVKSDAITPIPPHLLTSVAAAMMTNIPIGYDDGPTAMTNEQLENGGGEEGDEVTGTDDGNGTLASQTPKWQDGENIGMNQQSIPQGILVTVAVLVAIVMSSLGGCCLVIACSTSKVPNCPNIKHAPSRCRESSIFLAPPLAAPQTSVENVPPDSQGPADRRPLLLPNYDDRKGKTGAGSSSHNSNNNNNNNPGSSGLKQSSSASNNSPALQFTSSGLSPGRRVFVPAANQTTFTTFRTTNETDRHLTVSSSSPKISRDEAYSEARNEAKSRRHQIYYGRGAGRNGLGLFLSPPPPGPPCDVGLIDCGADINKNNSNSYPGDTLTKQGFLSNSQTELCTCSPDLSKNKKSSSGYRSMLLNGSDVTPDDLDASGGNSGVRSSEPGDDILLHPVACFSPVHENDIVRKTGIPVVTTEEITFI